MERILRQPIVATTSSSGVIPTWTVALGRWEVGRGELAAEPLEKRRVLFQPRVALGDGAYALPDELTKWLDLFAGDQADTALGDERLGDERLGDGRGPVAPARTTPTLMGTLLRRRS